jgi:hypothetical protein
MTEYTLIGRFGVLSGTALALLLTGCVAREARDSAKFLAGATHRLSEEGADFARTRTSLAQARRANVLMLERSTVELQTSIQRTNAMWAMEGDSGKQRADLLARAIAFGDKTRESTEQMVELRKRHEAAIASAKSSVEFRQAELSKVATALATLGEQPSMASEVKFFVAYFKEVNKSIESAKKEAKDRSEASEKAMASTTQPSK